MKPTLILGIDPGLVHTGIVSMHFIPEVKKILVTHEAVAGIDIKRITDFDFDVRQKATHPRHVFVEAYNPRVKLHQDKRMVEALADIRKALPRARIIPNTGVKKIVKKDLMELLGVWKFSTPTHHQDLRSAARIALLGMMKDDGLNALLYQVVSDHLEGKTWDVEHR